MRLLWLCNKCIPAVARHRGMEIGNREGWLAGISEKLMEQKSEELQFGICFPVETKEEEFSEDFGIKAYAFLEDLSHPERYEDELEGKLKKIIDQFQPDLVHIFGTEFPHALAMTRVFPHPERILIGIQGLCFQCSKEYLKGIPADIMGRSTLRDFLKKDGLREQQEKFAKRGEHEIEAIKNAGNITGRTDWDRQNVLMLNPGVKYFAMNETLRKNFYEGEWSYENCRKHSIFVSQGDYPIKGLHILLNAMSLIIKEYPDAAISVAGQDIVGYGNIKKTVLISEYGKYLKELIEQAGLKQNIHFLGNLSADEMKEQYQNAHVFVLCSVLENSPNAVGEAMLMGTPCIASAVGGVPSLITSEEGYLYKDCNPKQLAEAILCAFRDTDSQKGMTVKQIKGRERARKLHDGKRNYERLLEIYEEIQQNR